MKRLLTAIFAALTVVWAGSVFAGQFYGGKGFLHTNAALVMPPGALDLSLYTRGNVTVFEGEGNYMTNGTSALAATFGFSRRVELGFTQILYQDLNATPRDEYSASVLIPGNTYIRIKAANYSIGNNAFWGFMPALRYRVGLYQNLHLEPYAGAGIEFELTGLFSYYVKPLYPDEAPNFHFNLGFLNHNDADSPTDAAQEVNYLVSAVFPRPKFDYGIELYGANFVVKPASRILSREDWMYITPMLRYKLFKGLNFAWGVDVLLLGKTDTTIPTTDPLPNYPAWRLAMRVNFTPSTAFYSAPTFAKANTAGGGREKHTRSGSEGKGEMFSRQDLFRWGIEERGSEIQAVDLDLEKLRQERKKAEEELKQLREKLEAKQREEAGQK